MTSLLAKRILTSKARFAEAADAARAQLRVRGLGQDAQGIKASVDPGEPEVQEQVFQGEC